MFKSSLALMVLAVFAPMMFIAFLVMIVMYLFYECVIYRNVEPNLDSDELNEENFKELEDL